MAIGPMRSDWVSHGACPPPTTYRSAAGIAAAMRSPVSGDPKGSSRPQNISAGCSIRASWSLVNLITGRLPRSRSRAWSVARKVWRKPGSRSVASSRSAAAPVGAGILIQPVGMKVLADLSLLGDLARTSSRIEALDGRNPAGRRVMNLRYPDLGDGLHALGVHRGNLFALLHAAALGLNVTIRCDCEVVAVLDAAGGRQSVELADGPTETGFDAVVIANGTQSSLRRSLQVPQRCIPYPWGAIRAIRPVPAGMPTDSLRQLYSRADVMIGLLPTGISPGSGEPCVSFFWSLPAADFEQWRQGGLDAWRDTVVDYWPETEAVLTGTTREEFAFATYADVVMEQWHRGTRVIIGDAAHGMSPQLGQGTNLAPLDAAVLAECVARNNDIPAAFAEYSRLRRRHLRFYQLASRWLTPLFQSHGRVGPFVRDLAFPLMQRIPWTYREALRTVGGSKTGLLFDADAVTVDAQNAWEGAR